MKAREEDEEEGEEDRCREVTVPQGIVSHHKRRGM